MGGPRLVAHILHPHWLPRHRRKLLVVAVLAGFTQYPILVRVLCMLGVVVSAMVLQASHALQSRLL